MLFLKSVNKTKVIDTKYLYHGVDRSCIDGEFSLANYLELSLHRMLQWPGPCRLLGDPASQLGLTQDLLVRIYIRLLPTISGPVSTHAPPSPGPILLSGYNQGNNYFVYSFCTYFMALPLDL